MNESVKRLEPISKSGNDRRNLLHFCFTYVHPNRERIVRLGDDEVCGLFMKDPINTLASCRL